MTTVICIQHAACLLNCYHKTPHKHTSSCTTDTWGICQGECLPLDWVESEKADPPITLVCIPTTLERNAIR